MGRLIVVLGGQKSGKSSLAARRAAASGRPVVVVTPAEVRDEEFAQRVARHRADRPAGWATVETFDLAGAVTDAPAGAFVLVDALDTWLVEVLQQLQVPFDDRAVDAAVRERAETRVLEQVDAFTAAVADGDREVLVIAGQPGLGVHAGGPGSRLYVDLHGLAVQALARAADEALLVVAGRALPLPPDEATGHQPAAADGPVTTAAAHGPLTAAVDGPDSAAPGGSSTNAGDGLTAAADGSLTVEGLVAAVRGADPQAAADARERLAALATPPGALGRVGELGVRLAAIAGRCPPPVPTSPVVVVAAADHGVHAQGVSDWPQAVTQSMMATVAAGRAGVNAHARAVGADVVVVDVGTLTPGPVPPGVHDRRVRPGTRDLAVEPAMTLEECRAAIAAGAELTRDLLAGGADLLVTGDLGIANTTASACLIAALTGAPPVAVTGRGANVDDRRLPVKVQVVETALARHGEDRDPLGVLASLGGLEHAALVGVILAGAAAGVPVLLDGVITNAAALAAIGICPAAAGAVIPGHTSAEPGAVPALAGLPGPALLDLAMHLGEGSGGVLAVPLVQAAARVLHEVATLDEVTPSDDE